MFKLYYKIINAHRSTIITYCSIFLVIFIIFGLFSGNMDNSPIPNFEQTKPRIAITNNDQSELSQIVVKQLHKSNKVLDVGSTMAEQKDALFFTQIDAIVEIPKDFQNDYEAQNKNRINLQLRPDNARGVLLEQKINSYLSSISSYKKVDSSMSYQEASKLVSEDLTKKVDIKMQKSKKNTEEDWLRGQYYNFLSYILFTVIVMVSGAAMLNIYRSEMLKRILIAPINSSFINIKVIIANTTFALSLLAIFTIIILFIRNNMFSSSGLLLIVNSIVFALVCISFAFMAITFVVNKKNAHDKLDMICNVFGLCMSFLGGAFLPQSFIPENVLQISHFIPSFWYIKLNDSLLSITNITSDVLQNSIKYMGIQMLFAIFFITIGLVVMKNKRSQGEIIDSDFE